MDHQTATPGGRSAPGPSGTDRDEFVRIWQRVSPEPRRDAPITVYMEDKTPPAEDGFMYITPERPLPAVLPPAAPLGGAPQPAHRSCYGVETAEYAPILQNMTLSEIVNMRVYQTLRRRADGRSARLLEGLADDGAKRAKRLSTAYFLLSGTPYWPAPRVPHPEVEGSGLSALRGCYLRAQNVRAQCESLHERARDACFKILCRDMAEEERLHLQAIETVIGELLSGS